MCADHSNHMRRLGDLFRVKKVNREEVETFLEKKSLHLWEQNSFKDHQVLRDHQDKRVIQVQWEIMILVKWDHQDKM